MSLSVSERRIADVVVLDVVGAMVAGQRPHQVSDLVLRRLGDGLQRILLNLAAVDACDTTGVTSLVVCLAHVRTKTAALALARVQPAVRSLLDVCGLASTFQMFSEVAPAVVWIRQQPVDGLVGGDVRARRGDRR